MDITKLLNFSENADIKLQRQDGVNALMFATHSYFPIIELLKENIDPNLQRQSGHLKQRKVGWTASTIASQNGHFEIVHLLEKYIDPSSSSCKELDQSINKSIKTTISAVLIPGKKMGEPSKQLQSIQTTESVVELNVLPHSTIHFASLKQFFKYHYIINIMLASIMLKLSIIYTFH